MCLNYYVHYGILLETHGIRMNQLIIPVGVLLIMLISSELIFFLLFVSVQG